MNAITSFAVSLLASIVAVLFALFIDRKRLPHLIIRAEEEANADNTYPDNRGRWKFFRLKIENKLFPWFFKWVPRQTAESCRAKIEFYDSYGNPLFSFNGRWASTPEIPQLDHDFVLKLVSPDPVTIPVGGYEYLDLFVVKDGENCGYGWNNEAYFHNWKNPAYKLSAGSYKAKVTISTQNGISFTQEVAVTIGEDIDRSEISN